MKILVCISKTTGHNGKIAFTDNNTKFDANGVVDHQSLRWMVCIGPCYRAKADPSTVIHLVTVGLADADPIIRKALALGGDEAIRVNADSHDSYYIASQIAEVAKNRAGSDLVFTGKETIDGSSIGGMVAELLDKPYVITRHKVWNSRQQSYYHPGNRRRWRSMWSGTAGGSKLPERNGRAAYPEYERHHGRQDETAESGGTCSGGCTYGCCRFWIAACQSRRKLVCWKCKMNLVRLLMSKKPFKAPGPW